MKQATLLLTLLLLVAALVVTCSAAGNQNLKASTVPPKNKNLKKSTVPPKNKNLRKSTVPPKNKNLRKSTVPPKNKNLRKSTVPPKNKNLRKSTVPAVKNKNQKASAVSSAVGPLKDNLNTMNTILGIITSGLGLAGITSLDPVTGSISKILSIGLAILGLIPGKGESPEIQFMRVEFKKVHERLNAISLQMTDVMKALQWETIKSTYAHCEMTIIRMNDEYLRYLNANDPNNLDHEKRKFEEAYKQNPTAAKTLYDGIVVKHRIVSENFATAIREYTHNHRRLVMNFLGGLTGMILIGAQMDIAYEALFHGEANAKKEETAWNDRMNTLIHTMKQIDDEIVHNWHNQLASDMPLIVGRRHAETNEQFVGNVNGELHDKYPWRLWMVLAYQDVSGFDNHAVGFQDAVGWHKFRVEGSRNVVVVSSDPNTSTFNQGAGDQVLADVEGTQLRTTNAGDWLREMDHRAGDYNHVALRAAICWGCNVWWSAPEGRVSYRKLTTRVPRGRRSTEEKYVNGILFG